MTGRSRSPAPGRGPPTLQGLLDRIAAADLDPVQIASMDLHLAHLLRVRRDWASSQARVPDVAPTAAPAGGRAPAGN